MTLVISVSLVCALFIFIDLVPIYKNKQWWTFWVYTATIVFVYTVVILIASDVKIPSPAVPLKKMISAIYGL